MNTPRTSLAQYTMAMQGHIIAAASVAHEANRAYCEALGDYSQLPWREAPTWQKQSAINGVIHAIENPDATPEQSHESWLAEKQADGWQYGAVKDVENKLHPCYCEYSALPQEQRAKDYIFLGIARAYIKTLETTNENS